MNESNDDQVQKPRWYECLPDLSFLLVIIVIWAMVLLICLLPCPRRCCECCRAKSTMPAAVQTSTTVPLVVPDDIYKGYAMVAGVEVRGIARDRGLPPPPSWVLPGTCGERVPRGAPFTQMKHEKDCAPNAPNAPDGTMKSVSETGG